MEGFPHDVLQEEVEQYRREQAPLSDPNCGLEVVPYLVVEEDCAAGGVVQRLDGLDETLLDAELPEDLPQTVVPHPVESFPKVYEIVKQVPLML